MFFLLSRYRQQQVAPTLLARTPLIGDYTFAKDSLFAQMNLAGDELDVYRQLYTVLADRAPVPDLVVYLRASTDLLMLRIAMRDRAYEREMERAYIDALRQAYDRHFSEYTQTPLLVIDVSDLDYVQDSSALAFIEGQVRTALGIGAYQRPLPKMEPAGHYEYKEPAVSADTDRATAGWEALGEFLAANEAMGRVGVALADDTAGNLGPELGRALQDTMERLQRMAQTAGVELHEEV